MKNRSFVGFIFAILVSSLGAKGARIFNVTDYGAKGDGLTANATSIQQAIDAAEAAGEGIVLFPEGEYRTATIFLKDNVTLRLEKDAVIKGTSNYALYPANIEPSYQAFLLRKDRYAPRVLIVAIEKESITIEGEGVIHGNGEAPELKGKKRMDSRSARKPLESSKTFTSQIAISKERPNHQEPNTILITESS